MKMPTDTATRGHEYIFKFKKKITSRIQRGVAERLEKNSFFFRSYTQYGSPWFELRSPRNQNQQQPPDATLCISRDFIYLMRKSKSLKIWENLDDLKEYIEDDLDFICEGTFYSYRK